MAQTFSLHVPDQPPEAVEVRLARQVAASAIRASTPGASLPRYCGSQVERGSWVFTRNEGYLEPEVRVTLTAGPQGTEIALAMERRSPFAPFLVLGAITVLVGLAVFVRSIQQRDAVSALAGIGFAAVTGVPLGWGITDFRRACREEARFLAEWLGARGDERST